MILIGIPRFISLSVCAVHSVHKTKFIRIIKLCGSQFQGWFITFPHSRIWAGKCFIFFYYCNCTIDRWAQQHLKQIREHRRIAWIKCIDKEWFHTSMTMMFIGFDGNGRAGLLNFAGTKCVLHNVYVLRIHAGDKSHMHRNRFPWIGNLRWFTWYFEPFPCSIQNILRWLLHFRLNQCAANAKCQKIKVYFYFLAI